MAAEEPVSRVAAKMLQYLACQVKTVKNGIEAGSAYRQAQNAWRAFLLRQSAARNR